MYNKERKGEVLLTREQYAEIGWYGWMASYNGRFFSGGYSGHNVLTTNGKPRDYIKEQINNTLKSLSSLKGIEFVSRDYNDVDIPLNSIVYCDIPYKDTKQYETSKNFDYERFYEWCRKTKVIIRFSSRNIQCRRISFVYGKRDYECDESDQDI